MERRRLISAAAIAAVLATATPAGAAAKPAVHWRGTDCTEVVVLVPIPLKVAQSALPAGYTARPDAAGYGRVLFGVVRCASLRVNGVEQDSDVLSDAGISIEPVAGLRSAAYHLWQVAGSRNLNARTARLGLAGAHVPGVAVSTDLSPLSNVGRAEVPWPGADSVLDVVGARPGTSRPNEQTWVHEGRRGRVRTEYWFGRSSVPAGAGAVRTTSGSRVATFLGGPVAPSDAVGGFVMRGFDIDARVHLDR